MIRQAWRGVTVIALAFLCAAASQALADPTPPAPQLSVTGRAFVDVRPDQARLKLGVDMQRPTAAEASEAVAQAATAMIAAIKELGVDAKDIQTSAVTLTPVYQTLRDDKPIDGQRRLMGFRALNAVSVRVRDIARAGILVARIVERGANLFRGLSFDVSDHDARADDLRPRAVADALRKAALYARGAGLKPGRVLSIAPNEIGRMPPQSLMRSLAASAEAAPAPIEPGLQTIAEEVTVTVELVPQ